MSIINRSIDINRFKAKNRIIMPPMVCFNWADNDGFETVSRAEHYGKRAAGGTGMIVVEAASVVKDHRICDTQLGIWKDEHIPQFKNISEACHKEGSIVIVQIAHAGNRGVDTALYSSSVQTVHGRKSIEMSIDNLNQVKKDFVEAALRAKKAGLDGVEIHGAHGYLLNQFTSKEINKRTDEYGGSLDNRLRLALEIVSDIRAAVGEAFIISYRLGVNDPTFEEDKYFAKKLEKEGVDILNVSSGIGVSELGAPDGFMFSNITYMGVVIHDEVDIPVACVYGITQWEQAEYLLENKMIDMVAIGRGNLADPRWGEKAVKREIINKCYRCKPVCKYVVDGRNCPRFK